MQWLIDIVKEWVLAQGYLSAGFVDRGDPAVYDFVVGDFIKDDDWHVLDLSGIIPANVKGVALSVVLVNADAEKHFKVRTHGNANAINVGNMNTSVGLVATSGDLEVAPNEDGKIDYWITSVNWIVIRLTVKNWWF